jgi:hypothetical protein
MRGVWCVLVFVPALASAQPTPVQEPERPSIIAPGPGVPEPLQPPRGDNTGRGGADGNLGGGGGERRPNEQPATATDILLFAAMVGLTFVAGWLAADLSRPWRVRRWKRKAEEG